MRFYSISHSELMEMDNEHAHALYEAIPQIEAHEQLIMLKCMDFPMMKEDARQKLFRGLNKLANAAIIKEEARALTTADLAALLNKGI